MELDTNNHSVFLLYYHLVLVTKYLTILIIYWLKPANMMEKPVKSSDRES